MAGSAAAAWQASIGARVGAGSVFALLQSVAMGGCGALVLAYGACFAAFAAFVASCTMFSV
jgi:hypothetical protein